MSAAMVLLTGAAAACSAGGWAATSRTLRRRTAELAHQQHDGLTGLWRREGFEHHAPAALATGNAIALLDLDGFKQVNDTFGHATGDEVLRVTAARLTAELGESALIARLGGDEFALIAGLDFPAVHDQLDALSAALRAPLVVPGAGELAVGASLGVAWLCDLPVFDTDRAHRRTERFWADVLSEGLSAADAAMYAAKALCHDWQLFDRAVDPVRPAAAITPAPKRRYREHGATALTALTHP
ncbi:GGDEF domain-containing protein [Amycolatopsis sp. NPDC051903]|uniref:GGDEF domain-containing protein n=1 Tax=Amycolatopsis sp. NPDC051903 TaxID=3363936 RepID=UPI00378DE903